MARSVISLIVSIILLLSPVAYAGTDIKEPLVSAVFLDTDLKEALNEIVLQTGINIIADSTVSGVVTLDLANVPLEKALTMMLAGGGFSFRKIDDYYLIGVPDPRSPIFQRLAETETVQLRYIRAKEAQDLLPVFYDQFIRSSGDKDALTISAPRSTINQFKADLANIDKPDQQVLIEATITEVSSELLKEWGLDLLELTSAGSNRLPNATTTITADTQGISYESNAVGELLTRLKAQQGKDGVSIKANPQVLVGDRKTAELFVGEEQVIILDADEDTKRVEKVDVGVSLKVQPRIVGDNELLLNVVPNISHFTEEQSTGIVVRRSELNTSIYARDGQTVLLAGITLQEETNQNNKIPILGDLPIVNWLFRRDTVKQGERELLIFITPRIVER